MAAIKSPSEKGKATKYFTNEKLVLKIAGLSFSGNESTSYKIYAFLIIFCTNFMYPLLEFIELFKQDIEVISDMLIYLFAIYVGLAKTIVVALNRLQIGKMLEKLEEEPFTVNLERGGVQEEDLNKNCVWITNLQAKVYWIICFLTWIGSVTYTLIKRVRSSDPNDWELPFGHLTVINITTSPNFEITWCYQNIAIAFIVFHFATIDLVMAAVLAHVSYQFKMLQNCIRRIGTNCYTEMQEDETVFKNSISTKVKVSDSELEASKIPWNYLHKHLAQVVQYHLEITDLAKDMEHVFSKLLLLIFLGTLGILCFSVYRTSVVQNNMKVIFYMLEALSACIQVVTVCYWGEQVVSESQRVGRAAYEANFVGADLRFQQSLVMIIRRSQRPTKLTAGKFADVCLSTFAWIIRTSYSAFMVVSSRTSPEKR